MLGDRHRVVIIGGGFGGLHAARSLRHAPVEVTVIDRRNFHLFQPLLYQVATGGLSPGNIAAPLRSLLRRQRNARVLLAEAVGIDVGGRRVRLADGEIPYDSLIVATGARHDYFGHDQWATQAPGLKTVEDATDIRRRILSAFEAAERESDPDRLRAWLTFVIVGAGPTGMELAGAIGELARHTLRRDFRRINPADAQILLLDAADRIVPSFPPSLSAKAEVSLRWLGVTVRTGVTVVDLKPGRVLIRRDDKEEAISAQTVLWAAGVAASPPGKAVADATGAECDRAGRILVRPDLTVAGHPEIFVIGDLAHFAADDGRPLPGVAPVAMQQGRYVARLIPARLRGRALPPFRYRGRGTMATIGRAAAIADLGWVHISSRLAWLVWLFVHLVNIVELEHRVLVLIQWAWSYVTRNRAARLITGKSDVRRGSY